MQVTNNTPARWGIGDRRSHRQGKALRSRCDWLRFRPHCHDLRQHVADLLGVSVAEYTSNQMTYDLRRLRLKGVIYRPPGTNRYFVTPYGWKVARLFSRLDARVFRPAMAMFTGNDAVLPFPLRNALDRADAQLDILVYQAFPLPKAGSEQESEETHPTPLWGEPGIPS